MVRKKQEMVRECNYKWFRPVNRKIRAGKINNGHLHQRKSIEAGWQRRGRTGRVGMST